nr:hypothetical protein [Tanacetum cinerariifolium]
RQPVAVLHPGVGGFSHGLILAHDVHNFGPKPLRRVDAALVLGEVLAAPGAGFVVDFGGLGQRGVVFPEHKQRVGILGKFGQHAQQLALLVHGAGRAAGGVDGET